MTDRQMQPNEYQDYALQTALYADEMPDITKQDGSIMYCVLGIADEAGEVAGKFKKALRSGIPPRSLRRSPALLKELGDVAWYLSQLARELGFTLDEVFKTNINKLADRKARGVLRGDGDNR